MGRRFVDGVPATESGRSYQLAAEDEFGIVPPMESTDGAEGRGALLISRHEAVPPDPSISRPANRRVPRPVIDQQGSGVTSPFPGPRHPQEGTNCEHSLRVSANTPSWVSDTTR